MHKKAYNILIISLFLLVASCGYPKNYWEKNINDIDRAFVANKVGQKALDRGDYKTAIDAFSKAILINPTFLPAHEGRIKLSLKTGLILNGFDALEDAYKLMEMYDVLGTNKNRWKFKTYEIKLIAEQMPTFWYQKIRNLYKQEVMREPNVNKSEDFLFALLYSSIKAYEKDQNNKYLKDAKDILDKLDNIEVRRMTEKKTLRDKVLRLESSDEIDKITKAEIINNLSRSPTVNKLDMVIMLDQILNIKKYLPEIDVSKPLSDEVDEDGGSDYEHLGFAQIIKETHRYNLALLKIENGNFNAPRTLQRKEFARIMLDIILKKTGNYELKRTFWQKASPFPDISYLLPDYGAILACYNFKIMHGYPDGKFYPDREITGVEAIQGFWALKALDVNSLLSPLEKKKQRQLLNNKYIQELKGDVIIIDEEKENKKEVVK